MMNLKPVGIPYSLFLENLFPKTFDSSKLEEDAERVREAYRDKGYANAAVEEPKTQIRDEGGLNLFTFRPNTGKRVDILMPVEEGSRYRLGSITFTGNKAVQNVRALRATFAVKDGDWYNSQAMQKGMEALKKAYGQLGVASTSAPFRRRASTTQRKPSRGASTSTKASRSTFPALSSKATQRRATRLSAAS